MRIDLRDDDVGVRPDVRPYRVHAIVATTAVVVLPVLVVVLLLALSEPNPSLFLTSLLGVGLSIGAATVGTAIWLRRPESAELTFGELMLWTWFRRARAEEKLEEGTRLLGLDRQGQPFDFPRVTREQQLQVLRDLTGALESKDPYTHGHSQRVERHAYRTALAMHLHVDEIEELRMAAALHDVGKIRVPEKLLRKEGGLTIEERAVVQEHTVVGAWMVSNVGSARVVESVRHHHESYDGSGYPDGLASNEIPLFARIIAVADAYDAMTSSRPYRASVGRQNAVEELRNQAGAQFDPEVVEAFLSTLPMPVPIAALIPLLPESLRALREMSGWFQRTGAGNIAPAAAAAGAAVMLATAVPTTPPTAIQPRQPTMAARSDDTVSAVPSPPSRDEVRGKRVSSAPPKNKKSDKRESRKKDSRNTKRGRQPSRTTAEARPAADPRPAPEPAARPTREPRQTREPQPTVSDGSQTNPNEWRDGCTDGDAGKGNDDRNC